MNHLIYHLYSGAILRIKAPFTLIKRKHLHCIVWAYRVYSEEGTRLEYSTGLDARTISKTAARAAVLELFKNDKLIPENLESFEKKHIHFDTFATNFLIEIRLSQKESKVPELPIQEIFFLHQNQ